MKINEVEQKTGLTKKAIRLYESKGLLDIERSSNSYREYREEDVHTLMQIKLLRLAGVSLADIKMFFDQLITLPELLRKREKELKDEYGSFSKQLENCRDLLHRFENNRLEYDLPFDEATAADIQTNGPLAVGIDIGTTTISATVISLTAKKQIESYTIPNGAAIDSAQPFFAEQDASMILEKIQKLAAHLTATYTDIVSIGFTGQMHGMLYLNAAGEAVSPLATWQDGRGNQQTTGGMTYCEEIERIAGVHMATGFGFTTHYYNVKNGLVPTAAVTVCTIMDYAAMSLAGANKPLMHVSNAASYGLFDIENGRFMTDKLAALGMTDIELPAVTDDYAVIGHYKGIPVTVAIGDNQASFLGSVQDTANAVLVNMGTGSQISIMVDEPVKGTDLETRPLVRGKYLLNGSALCGGSSYALLERFFRAFAKAADMPGNDQYTTLNALAVAAYEQQLPPLQVSTLFRGTRKDPTVTGSITGITPDNFTPEQMALGFVTGMCEELYQMYRSAAHPKTKVIASGNCVQKIPIMKHVLSEMFGAPVSISKKTEEAAFGAALFSLIAVKELNDIAEFSAFIDCE